MRKTETMENGHTMDRSDQGSGGCITCGSGKE